jgi:NAD(P)-dependent dehydrogenase (short-subunit alcohol dehydrogenase family)
MKVMIADIWQEHIDEALELFAERGLADSVDAVQLDVSDRAAYERAAAEFEAKLGKLHLLCNNAGLGAGMRMKTTTYQDWDWALGVMIGGAVNGIVNFLPKMIAHGEGGHIVNTSSMSGVLQPAMKGGVTYTTGKAALIGMVEQSRLDLAEDNIGISALIPGPVRSNIFKISRTRPERFANEAPPAPPPVAARRPSTRAAARAPRPRTGRGCPPRRRPGRRRGRRPRPPPAPGRRARTVC